jgi:hypothetical protein
MTTPPDPAQEFSQELSSLQNDLASLQSKVQLADSRKTLEDLNTRIIGLPQAIKNLRDRKYIFDKDFETRASELASRWISSYQASKTYIDQQAAQLEIGIRPIESQVGYVATQSNNPAYGLSMIQSLRANMETLDSKASGSDSTAAGMYAEIKSQFDLLTNAAEKIEWMLDRIDEASFPFLPAEAGIMAVKGTWCREGHEDKDDPHGILFLTDQRLIFEQNEEIATKKVLFITTERKKVQQKLLELVVTQVDEIKASNQGLFKNEDFIDLRLAHGAPVPSAQFHIFGQESSAWQALVNNAKTHEFDQDRVTPINPEEIARVKTAPSICPACGGAITQPVLRGIDTITCEFCGNVIRL